MSQAKKIHSYKTLGNVAKRLRSDLNDRHFVLLFAYNGTGKTRLSMAFKDLSKLRKKSPATETLYYNAFTEDLFFWHNDLQGDTERHLIVRKESKFFNGFKELALDDRIFDFLERYTNFNFDLDIEKGTVVFSKQVKNPKAAFDPHAPEYITANNIKISRGEENLFIWCVFLAICELVIDGDEAYNWVKYLYIDDPISSLDDNNAIALASDLGQLLKRGKDQLRVVVSSHHSLFFNIMYNELKAIGHKSYFFHQRGDEGYRLQATHDTPFFHHVALVSELQSVAQSGKIYTYHFNVLRSVLEKTANFFGYSDFSACISGIDDEVLYARALNLLSHGKYSIYQPVEMNEDNKDLFKSIFKAFTDRYSFNLPELFG